MENKMEYAWDPSNLPMNEYRFAYQSVRRILCDAKTFDHTEEETIEKCMWICAMADTMNEVPKNALRVVSTDHGITDSTTLIRREFPRMRSWHKWLGERKMNMTLYSMIYEDICSISRDADDFDIHGEVSDLEVEKCAWIAAIREVTNDLFENYATPTLAKANMEYDWFDFYDNYYYEYE